MQYVVLYFVICHLMSKLEDILLSKNQKEISAQRQRAISSKPYLDQYLLALSHIAHLKIGNIFEHHMKVYSQVTELLLTADPKIVAVINNILITQIIKNHCYHSLDEYFQLWSNMYDGSLTMSDYPNIKKTITDSCALSNLQLLPDVNNTDTINQYLERFGQKLESKRKNRVQFSDEQNQSLLSVESNEPQQSSIMYMNVMELKAIKQKIKAQYVPQEIMDEYVSKMRNYLNLSHQPINGPLRKEYDSQRSWIRQFLTNYDKTTKNHELRQHKISLEEDIEHLRTKRRKIFQVSKININNKQQRKSLNHVVVNSLDPKVNPQQKVGAKQIKQVPSSGQRYNFMRAPNEVQNGLIDHPKMSKGISNLDSDISRYLPENKNHVKSSQKLLSSNKYKEQQIPIIQEENYSEMKTPLCDFQKSPEAKRPLQKYKSLGNLQGFSGIQRNVMDQVSLNQTKLEFGPLRRQKLSQIKSKKKKILANQQLMTSNPYAFHFNSPQDYTSFKKICLQNQFSLFSSDIITIICKIQLVKPAQVKVHLSYFNKSKNTLSLFTQYRIPKCFTIKKMMKIKKKFMLQEKAEHQYVLKHVYFPLQMCMLGFNYSPGMVMPIVLPIPITLLSFSHYIKLAYSQWLRNWQLLINRYHSRPSQASYVTRLIEPNQIAKEDLKQHLPEFIEFRSNVQPLQKSYGACVYFQQLGNTMCYVKISLLQYMLSIEAVMQKLQNNNQNLFLNYYAQVWQMLLGK